MDRRQTLQWIVTAAFKYIAPILIAKFGWDWLSSVDPSAVAAWAGTTLAGILFVWHSVQDRKRISNASNPDQNP
jgi:hypothetical protein